MRDTNMMDFAVDCGDPVVRGLCLTINGYGVEI